MCLLAVQGAASGLVAWLMGKSQLPGGDPHEAEGFQFDLERMKPEGAIVQGVTDWHGWRISDDPDGYSIHIGHLPGRKKVALYSEDDDHFKVLAYFQDEAAAQEMADWIDRMQDMMNAVAEKGLKTGRRL